MANRVIPAFVYISSHNLEEAEALAEKIRAAGHVVVSTWHAEVYDPQWAMSPAARDGSAVNLALIEHRADVLVLQSGPDKYPGGKFVEAGFAMGKGCPWS